MSKKSFSQEIDKLMYRKTKSLENGYYDDFFSKSEYFELVLCLAYMTLSKEKIIKKDMRDNRRLERLTRMVSTQDIDLLFDSSFCSDVPKIIASEESDKTWILDNIRDSIMHGMFEIDEERKCFIIDNDYFDRTLKAEVPFSWFISYAKNDILSKKKLDKCTIKGFYYNIGKQKKRRFEPGMEAKSHILYIVDVEGSKVNVRNVERRVKELFEECSRKFITDDDVLNYKDVIAKEKFKYGDKYFVSFCMAKDYVKEQIEKEFPGTNVRIHIDNRKGRTVNRIRKNNPLVCPGYDLLFDRLNSSIGKKSDLLLQYITNMIENLDSVSNVEIEKMSDADRTDFISKLLKGHNINCITWRDTSICHDENVKILRSICLNVYGLATLVLNHEDLYNKHFLDKSPFEFNIKSYATKPFLEYMGEQRKLVLDYLEQEITIFDDDLALKTCTNPKGVEFRTRRMMQAEKKRENLREKMCNLQNEVHFEKFIDLDSYNSEADEILIDKIYELYEHFCKATTVQAKRDIKKAIGEYMIEMTKIRSNYIYGYCRSMEEALVIIRNAFSHIGRIYVGKERFKNTTIILNDFDIDGKKSGAVMCPYFDLINLLRNPFYKGMVNEDEKSGAKK